MRAPLWALLALCTRRWLALATAAAALAVVAAAVEGQAPQPARLQALATGPALAVAVAWGLQAWRAATEDVALAALGHRPHLAVLAVAALATGTAAVAASPTAAPRVAAEFTATRATFHTADGPVSLTWHGGEASRASGERWRALPAPTPDARETEPGDHDPTPFVVALAAVAVGLGPRTGPFAATGIAAALWLLGAAIRAAGWT